METDGDAFPTWISMKKKRKNERPSRLTRTLGRKKRRKEIIIKSDSARWFPVIIKRGGVFTSGAFRCGHLDRHLHTFLFFLFHDFVVYFFFVSAVEKILFRAVLLHSVFFTTVQVCSFIVSWPIRSFMACQRRSRCFFLRKKNWRKPFEK